MSKHIIEGRKSEARLEDEVSQGRPVLYAKLVTVIGYNFIEGQATVVGGKDGFADFGLELLGHGYTWMGSVAERCVW